MTPEHQWCRQQMLNNENIHTQEPNLSIKTISRLLQRLNKENILFCHWKSNANLDRALVGQDDLDLLVAEEEGEKFLTILAQLGFVKARSSRDQWFPSICHYYAYDAESDRLVHIHLHFRLLIGYDLLKHYHLPIEKAFLHTTRTVQGMRIPIYELEFVIFVIRMVLKRRFFSWAIDHPRHWLNGCLGLRGDKLPGSARQELEFLQKNIDQTTLSHILREHFPFMDDETFNYCLESISQNSKPLSWLRARRRLEKSIGSYRLYSEYKTFILVLFRMVCVKGKGLLKKIGVKVFTKKRLQDQGVMVALIGGDGAGKTTNIEELKRWFGKTFDVQTLHIGKPARKLWEKLAIFLLRVMRILTLEKGKNLYYGLMYFMLARRRYLTFCRAKMIRSEGILVFLDRVSLPQLTAMDAPQVRKRTGGLGVYAWLAAAEEGYYDKIRGMDEIIVLRLDPQVAAQRRPEDEPADLRKRSGEIWNTEWPDGYAHVLDASEPLNDVQRKIRNIVWLGIQKNRTRNTL